MGLDWLDKVLSKRGTRTAPQPDLAIGILLWPGFPLMSLSGLIEPLRHVADFGDGSRPIHCTWSILGDEALVTDASCGVGIKATSPYRDPRQFDYVVVVGGLLQQLNDAPQRHIDYLNLAAAAGVPIIGACTGVFILAREGLLQGKTACVHPFHREDFQRAFPRASLTSRDDYLIDGDRLTVMGGVSTLSLMTELIARHCGPDRMAKMAHQLSLPRRDGLSRFDRARLSGIDAVADNRVQRAVVSIETRRGKDLTLKDIAAAVHLSPRQFTRLFTEHMGMSPNKFILDCRLRHARFLIANNRATITEIALDTGFASGAHLATAFKARYGINPIAFRNQLSAE